MNIYNPPTASQVIGLGTAALKNTGTSGDAVPVLNGSAATWAAGATFTYSDGFVNLNNTNTGVGGLRFQNGGTLEAHITQAPASGIMAINAGRAPAWGGSVQISADTALVATINATGLDVVGLSRCDSFRIDQAATVETIASDRTITINANGTEIRLLAAAAA